MGTVIAIFRLSMWKWLRAIGYIYVEFIRNTPLLIQVFFFYFGLPSIGIKLNAFQSGTIGLSIYTAAFIAEAVRAGIQSIPKGQMEAGRSSGLTYLQTMYHIIIPQAIKLVVPALGNQFLNLVKNSSILGVIAGGDLMYHADIVSSETYVVFDVYIFVAIFYLILTIPLSVFVNFLEKRMLVTR